MHKHWDEFIALYPRTECLETPIEDPVKENNSYKRGLLWVIIVGQPQEIKEVDNNLTNPMMNHRT